MTSVPFAEAKLRQADKPIVRIHCLRQGRLSQTLATILIVPDNAKPKVMSDVPVLRDQEWAR